MIKPVVLPLCYFPPVSWLAAASYFNEAAIEVHQSYRKQRYTSRAHIRVANQVMTLSVPVERRSRRAPIVEKQVIYQEDWQGNHWRSIKFAYKSSPYFEYYEDELARFFKTNYESLTELNMVSTRFLCKALGLDVKLETTESLEDTEHYQHDWRMAFDPGRNQMPEWFSQIPYTQVFPGFEHDLSGLDILFNLGPEARLHLKRLIFSEKK